jgi:SnoaL-like polyketide cyclase
MAAPTSPAPTPRFEVEIVDHDDVATVDVEGSPVEVETADLVTTYKTYHGTHQGEFLGIPATGRKVSFHTVDAMRVVNGKITEHWGVATLLDLMQQLGVVPALGGQR